MIILRSLGLGTWVLAGLLIAGWGATSSTQAADLSLKAQLIWGTDEGKPKAQKITEVEPRIRKKLERIFKWKNYFVVHEQQVSLSVREPPKRLKLSSKCEVELKELDEFTVEIKLFGEGKWTKTIRQSIKALNQGELAVLGGDDKEKYNDAWFVVLSVPVP